MVLEASIMYISFVIKNKNRMILVATFKLPIKAILRWVHNKVGTFSVSYNVYLVKYFTIYHAL